MSARWRAGQDRWVGVDGVSDHLLRDMGLRRIGAGPARSAFHILSGLARESMRLLPDADSPGPSPQRDDTQPTRPTLLPPWQDD